MLYETTEDIEDRLRVFIFAEFGVKNPSPQSVNGVALSILHKQKKAEIEKLALDLVKLAHECGFQKVAITDIISYNWSQIK